MAIITNQATLSYNGYTITSNTTTGELLSVLTATKTAVSENYCAGSTLTYSISINNSGPVAYSNVKINDDLGAYLFDGSPVYPLEYTENSIKYYSNGVLQSAPTVSTSDGLLISGICVPSGGNVILLYEAKVTSYAPLGTDGEITNTATINDELDITTITTSESVYTKDEAVLGIIKSMCPTSATIGTEISYVFTIENTGNTEAGVADDVVVTDTFNPPLEAIAVTYNGTDWVDPTNYTYDSVTGEFETVLGQITVPAATYDQDSTTGEYTTTPGTAVIKVTGTL